MLTDDIASLTCTECGVWFALIKEHIATLKASGKHFSCPNGHTQFFLQEQSVTEKALRLENRALRAQVTHLRDQLGGQAAERRGDGTSPGG
jgi:hypothetical protein